MRARPSVTLALMTCLTTQTGCFHIDVTPPAHEPSPFANVTWSAQTNGLSDADRDAYYAMDEGIQYLPVDMLLSLARPIEQGSRFKLGLYDELLLQKPERYGLYPNPRKPFGAPIGITESQDPDYVPMAGLNCATCHTTVLTHTRPDGTRAGVIIDGGSSLFAIDRFLKDMIFSMVMTILDADAFDAFYERYTNHVKARSMFVEAGTDEVHHDKGLLCEERDTDAFKEFSRGVLTHMPADKPKLEEDMEKYEQHMTAKLVSANKIPQTKKHNAWKSSLTDGAYPTADELNTKFEVWTYLIKRIIHFAKAGTYAPSGGTPSGLGRSNPWAVTKNLLADHGDALHTLQIGIETKKKSEWPRDVSAPINTPHLWGFNDQKWVFWTGVTNSMEERNLAQGIALVTDFNWKTWETTISVERLHEMMDRYTTKIKSPRWPADVFGPLDDVKVSLGKKVFQRECLGCHSPGATAPGPGSTVDNYVNAKTDQWYYEGQIASYYGLDLFTDVLRPWLATVKQQAYRNEHISPDRQQLFEAGRLPSVWKPPGCNAVIAKPLYGVWATAPFLHNGSVPSIRQLLTAPADRASSFYVGDLEYDPRDLGFRFDPVDPRSPSPPERIYYASAFAVKDDGNSNEGHAFGTCLQADEKDALIEFLKAYQPDTQFDGQPGKPTCCAAPGSTCSQAAAPASLSAAPR